VFSGPKCIELADPSRVRVLLKAPNVTPVRRRKDRCIVELQISAGSDDAALKASQRNPRRHSHNHAVDKPDWTGNPERVWTLRPISRKARPIFRAVLDSCAA
jgi:hypothetical protein